MSVDDRARLQLHTRLGQVLGDETADTLMEELGSLGREQLATRSDVHKLGSELRVEMAELRSDLTTDMAQLRTDLTTDMAQLRTDLTTDMAQLRTDLTTDMARLRGEFGGLRGEFSGLRAEVAERLEAQTRTLLLAFVGMMASIGGLAFGAARLL